MTPAANLGPGTWIWGLGYTLARLLTLNRDARFPGDPLELGVVRASRPCPDLLSTHKFACLCSAAALTLAVAIRGQFLPALSSLLTPSGPSERGFGRRPLNLNSKESYMETETKQIQKNNQGQGFFAEPRIFLTKDGEYLIHVLPGNMIVRKHVNFYKKILGMEFVPKAKPIAA